LGPDEFERLEIQGHEFQPGAGVHLSDDRTGGWSTPPRDVTVVSPSRVVVEKATHGEVPADGGGPVGAILRVNVTCPGLPPVTNSFTIEFLD
jgi:hypothetical protein